MFRKWYKCLQVLININICVLTSNLCVLIYKSYSINFLLTFLLPFSFSEYYSFSNGTSKKRPSTSSTIENTGTKNNRCKYKTYQDGQDDKLTRALQQVMRTGNISSTAKRHNIPKSTLAEKFKKMTQGISLDRKTLCVLTDEEEAAVVLCMSFGRVIEG